MFNNKQHQERRQQQQRQQHKFNPQLLKPHHQAVRRPRDEEDCSDDPDVEKDQEKFEKWKETAEEEEREQDIEAQVPAELNDNTVVPQEYEAYMSSQAVSRHHHISGKIDLAKQIDPIDGRLVAKLNIELLFRRIHANPFRQRSNFETTKTILQNGNINFLLKKPEEVVEARIKKRIQAAPRPIQPVVSAALRFLMRRSRFLIGTRYPKRTMGEEAKTHCGAFFVKKSNGMLRVILDGRYANVYFKPDATSFAFFKYETLRNVISNLSEKKEWFALNYDLRHWFHQIPLPRVYLKYLGMILTDRKKNSRGRFWALPRSLPMGFLQAPYIAQHCSWGLVLTQPEGMDWKGSNIDSHYLHRVQDQGTAPSWVPLLSGGGIFVFLDNILVVTPREDVARWWENKIIRDCKDMHAWLKSDNEAHNPKGSVEEQKATLANCFVKLTADNEKSFDFLGVRWTHSGRSVILKNDDNERGPLPGLTEPGSPRCWEGSRRDMAGILGKLMWYRRVHGTTYFDADASRETRAILSLYRKLAPPSNNVSPKKAWDEPFTQATREEIDGLIEAWKKRAACTVSKATPQTLHAKCDEVVFAITDAAITAENNAGALAGGCWYEAGVDCLPDARAGSYHPPKPATVESTYFALKFQKEKKIAFGEMFAIKETVERLLKTRMNEGRKTSMIVLATDNLSCKYWIEKGHARSEDIQNLLREIHHLLESASCRLYLTYVNTEDNFADEISRNKLVDATKLEKNHKLLTRAFVEASTSMWTISGGVVGGNERE